MELCRNLPLRLGVLSGFPLDPRVPLLGIRHLRPDLLHGKEVFGARRLAVDDEAGRALARSTTLRVTERAGTFERHEGRWWTEGARARADICTSHREHSGQSGSRARHPPMPPCAARQEYRHGVVTRTVSKKSVVVHSLIPKRVPVLFVASVTVVMVTPFSLQMMRLAASTVTEYVPRRLES